MGLQDNKLTETSALKSCDKNNPVIQYDNGTLDATADGAWSIKSRDLSPASHGQHSSALADMENESSEGSNRNGFTKSCGDRDSQLSSMESYKMEETKHVEKQGLNWSTMPTNSKYTLLLCSLGAFFSGIEFFYLASYFPIVANEKQVSGIHVGVVFSIFHIIIFFSSPLFGNHMPRIGVRFLYLSSAFFMGTTTILFGFVDRGGDGASFVIPSIMCRAATAVGNSGFVTAGFAILTNEFPKHAATAFGVAEVATGLGFMAAPAIGGALYQVGGFGMPPFTIGGLVLLNGLFLYLALPPTTCTPVKRKGSVFSLFKSPLFVVAILNFFVSTVGSAYPSPTLSTRLEPFHLSPAVIGVFFLIISSLYTVMSPVFGYLSDVKGIPATIMTTGTLIMAVSCFLLGPCPGIPFLSNDIWMVVIALALNGMGYGAAAIPTVKLMIMGAIEVGLPDNLDTYGLVSGAFYSILCAGAFVGNSLGGALMDFYGFAFAAMIFGVFNLTTFVLTVMYFSIRRYKCMKDREQTETSLLNNTRKDHTGGSCSSTN